MTMTPSHDHDMISHDITASLRDHHGEWDPPAVLGHLVMPYSPLSLPIDPTLPPGRLVPTVDTDIIDDIVLTSAVVTADVNKVLVELLLVVVVAAMVAPTTPPPPPPPPVPPSFLHQESFPPLLPPASHPLPLPPCRSL